MGDAETVTFCLIHFFFFFHANTHFIRSPASILSRETETPLRMERNDNVTEYAAFALISSKRAKEKRKCVQTVVLNLAIKFSRQTSVRPNKHEQRQEIAATERGHRNEFVIIK